MQHYTYLLLMLFTLSFPLLRSFEPRLRYYRNVPHILVGVFVMMLLFIPWDIVFTAKGLWGFNPDYITGWYIANLPIEEWMFFVLVPYACVFIYEAANHLISRDYFGTASQTIAFALAGFCSVMAVIYHSRWYPLITFSLLAMVLAYIAFIERPQWLGRFFLAFAIIKIPFFIINGVLTGSWIAEPVVWYNNAENMAIRIGTVPFEDGFYNMLMLLMVVWVFERLRASKPERITWLRHHGNLSPSNASLPPRNTLASTEP